MKEIFQAYIVDRPVNPARAMDGLWCISHLEKIGTLYEPPVYIKGPVKNREFALYQLQLENKVYRVFDIVQPIELAGQKLADLHLALDQGLVQSKVFDATMKVLLIALVSIVLGLALTLILVTLMMQPVGKLVKGVLAIAGGNFDTRVKVRTRDELGQLSRAFNKMARSLSENEMLKGAFSRYVSDAALSQLLSDPSKTGLHNRKINATVYSSDVRGFTSMSETLQPEEVVAVINTYLSLQTEILLENGGVVDKFIGDATIGVFGKESEEKDDAFRCVLSAVKIQEKISELNAEREARGEIAKQIGIGINTGAMVAGNMGSSQKMEYTVAGENAILADKLCDECPGGKVWITESTYREVKDFVLVRETEPIALQKGAVPSRVYEITGLKKQF